MNQQFKKLELNLMNNNINSNINNIQIKTYVNGDRYEGQLINNKREGKGIYYYNDGRKI